MKRRRTTNKCVYKKEENTFLTVPNVLSLFRIELIPVIVWLYAIRGNMVWSGVVLIVSGLTDIADRWIARHYNMVSEVGKALDPIADKLTQGAVLLCMIFRFPLLVVPFILLLDKEAFVGVHRFAADPKKRRCMARKGSHLHDLCDAVAAPVLD